MNDKIENTKEAEILTSGGTTIEIQRGSKNTRIELNILHRTDDDQLSSEDLLSQIHAAFEAPNRGSHWRDTFLQKLNQIRKLLDKVESNFVAVEMGDENDPTFLSNFSQILNVGSRVVLPMFGFDLHTSRMEVESLLECIRQDNEPESDPRPINPLPISPARPVSPRAVGSNTSNTNPPQNSGNGKTEKSDKSRTVLSPAMQMRLAPFYQRKNSAGTNGVHTEPSADEALNTSVK
jgi:hypothetical protein